MQFFPRLQEVRTDRFEPINTEVDMTVPNQTMTLKEIVARFRAGQEIPVGKRIRFDENPDFDNYDPTEDKSFDLSDYSEMMDEIKLKRERKKNEQKTSEGSLKTASEPAKPSEVVSEAERSNG